MRSTLPSTLALLIIGITSLNAQDLYQFQNRWKPNEYIIADRLKLSTSTIRPDWWSAQWLFESVEGYYRINSRGGNHFVNIEYGPVECSSIEPGWWSAQWALEPVDGTSFIEFVIDGNLRLPCIMSEAIWKQDLLTLVGGVPNGCLSKSMVTDR